jgi:hypothetical protein
MWNGFCISHFLSPISPIINHNTQHPASSHKIRKENKEQQKKGGTQFKIGYPRRGAGKVEKSTQF